MKAHSLSYADAEGCCSFWVAGSIYSDCKVYSDSKTYKGTPGKCFEKDYTLHTKYKITELN